MSAMCLKQHQLAQGGKFSSINNRGSRFNQFVDHLMYLMMTVLVYVHACSEVVLRHKVAEAVRN